MNYIGVDIGSTCAKVAVLNEDHKMIHTFVQPTGWSSFEAVSQIERRLNELGIERQNSVCVSTGYGRGAVDFAVRQVTEITCHAQGVAYLFGDEPCNVIDVGGQDTKVISCSGGRVEEFYMNDKCSAGTGKFIEIMANRLRVSLHTLDEIAANRTQKLTISSLCTVFAESEIVALIGGGTTKENIAWGVLNSVVRKITQEYSKLSDADREIILTGGLCENTYLVQMLSDAFGKTIQTSANARYAGAAGAAVLARRYAKK